MKKSAIIAVLALVLIASSSFVAYTKLHRKPADCWSSCTFRYTWDGHCPDVVGSLYSEFYWEETNDRPIAPGYYYNVYIDQVWVTITADPAVMDDVMYDVAMAFQRLQINEPICEAQVDSRSVTRIDCP